MNSLPYEELDKLYPKIRAVAGMFLNKAQKLGAHLFCGYRSFDEQEKLYAQGRTIFGAVITNAKAGESWHNYGLAMDIVFKDENGWTWHSDKWDELGALGDEYGFEWGGNWPSIQDKPHFQMTYALKLPQLKKLYLARRDIHDVWDMISSVTRG